ncbi:MAG TPA: N-methylproline demethylase, partial [Burkholderiaceae bacterium]|nr:N-methylproline demethylase [Burkholderiaceae bacterium]
MRYEHLFAPMTLNKLVLRNRIVSTAHAEVYAGEGGLPGERYIRYYEEKAKGGLGLAICGGSSPVSINSPQGWWKSVNLATDAVVEPLSQLAEAMHRHGAKIMIQATHMGRRSAWHGEHWPHLVSPSGVREPVHRGNAKTIEIEEIQRIVRDFAKAADRVKRAGMDGMEVSAAHQHLIDQFWSPRTNFRSDEYGGSLENRLRFGIEALTAIREAVGTDFCVGLRMCGDEFHDDGLDHEQLKEIAHAMADTGLVDYISVVGSGADTHNTLANCMPPMALPPEPFVHLAAGIKSVVRIPVMHAQSIRDANQAERILAAGLVDLVGMTRAQIADPHMVIKIRDGREDEIKQCVGANYCIDRQY